MQFLHERTNEAVKSEVSDYFSPLLIQTSIIDGYYTKLLPVNSLESGNTIDFHLPGNDNSFIDLSSIYFYMKVKATDEHGNRLTAQSKCALVNNIAHNLFKDINISFNGKLVSSGNQLYPYNAYLNTILFYSKLAKGSGLQAAGFVSDDLGTLEGYAWNAEEAFKAELDQIKAKMDAWTPQTTQAEKDTDTEAKNMILLQKIQSVNVGSKTRTNWFVRNNEVELIGNIFLDVCMQERPLPNKCDLLISFTKNTSKFVFLARGMEPKFEITSMALYVRKNIMNPGLLTGFEKQINEKNALMPITRWLTRTYNIPQGSFSFEKDNLFFNTVPRQLYIALVRNSALNGVYAQNPFRFRQEGLISISTTFNGRQIPTDAIEMNYLTETYLRGYHTLAEGLNRSFKNVDLGVSREEFFNGFAIYCINLDVDSGSSPDYYSLQRSGNLKLSMRFNPPTFELLSVLIFGVVDAVIEFTPDRQVIMDYQP